MAQVIQQSNRFYAIRLKGTNKYLPSRKRLRGFSFDEPAEPDKQHTPRLFTTFWAAQCALIAWLRGKHVCHRSGGYSSIEGVAEYDEYTTVQHQVERKRENMEIVELELHEIMAYPLRLKHE